MAGRLNLITDVPGIRIGNAHDARLASGVTVALFDRPAVASVFVAGGGAAGRDQECLEPDRTVERIDAIALSGGSGFGLDAGSGVQAWLRERGRGLPVGATRVPIVPSAILFDLLNGGAKDWGRFPPYRDLAYLACDAAAGVFRLGTEGGGYGATTVNLKGGLGSASAATPRGFTVGALACVNAIGSAVVGDGPHFWAAPFEHGAEFGGLGAPLRLSDADRRLRWKGQSQPATTLCLVATDATLTKAQLKRLAIMAQGGLAKALRLSHAPADGDTVFAVSTLARPTEAGPEMLTELGAMASDCLARAIARGVHAATALPFEGALESWSDRFDGAIR
ncbi:MAG: L-aminopeptidase/D-esterase [Enterovirga sp.]|nr:L-aminopeptidase/D-esterase [Enterovirga sp.]